MLVTSRVLDLQVLDAVYCPGLLLFRSRDRQSLVVLAFTGTAKITVINNYVRN